RLAVFASAGMRGRRWPRRLPGFVAARGVDARRPGLGEQRRQNFRRLATAKAEAAATLCQVFGDGGEALMQPPARSAAHAPTLWRGIVENVERQDRRTGF